MPADHPPQRSTPEPCLAQTKALVLSQDAVLGSRLIGRLGSFGIETREASCASGAAAILRRADLRRQPIDFLIVDGRFQGICGMSLSAALCVTLRKRPIVLLQAPLEDCLDREALNRSGVKAVLETNFGREELQALLENCQTA